MPLLSGLKTVRMGNPLFTTYFSGQFTKFAVKIILRSAISELQNNLISKQGMPYMVMMVNVKMFTDIVINYQ